MEGREYLKKIKDDGWYLGDTEGASRQYVHRDRPGTLTVCVRHTQELGPETQKRAFEPAKSDIEGSPEVVIEDVGDNMSAYCPNLTGVVATGADELDVRERMSEAVALHRRGLQSDQ